MGTDTVTVIDNSTGKRVELPLLRGTLGPSTIDVRTLYRELGYFTYDPGYMSTASCESKITFLDGDRGILLYRGYPIEQLAQHSTFPEVCYLLLYRKLPTQQELDDFNRSIKHHTLLHEAMRLFYRGFRHDAHAMAIMVAGVGALASFYPEALNVYDRHDRETSAHRLIAKMPTLAAWSYKYSVGQPLVYPRKDLGFTANFLYMLFSVPNEEYPIDEIFCACYGRDPNTACRP